MSHPQIGTVAPDFTLTNTHGAAVTLSELRGKPVLIVFIPFAFSGICTGELCELRDNVAVFESADVTLLAVSTDPMFSLKAWAEKEGYTFDLLSDFWPHGEVAQQYGVFNAEKGMAVRGSFLIDAAGVVRWAVVNEPGAARSFAGYEAALQAISPQ